MADVTAGLRAQARLEALKTPEEKEQERLTRIMNAAAERPPDLPWYGRIGANALASIPRIGTGMGMLPDVAAAGTRAANAYLAKKAGFPVADEETDLATQMLGKEGVKEVQDYVEKRTMEIASKIPNPTDEEIATIQGHVSSSKEAEEIALKHTSALYRSSMHGANWVNEHLGLRPVRNETSTDEAIQALSTALIPINRVIGPLARGGNLATRVAARAGELVIPGSSGTPGSIAANAGVDIVQDQLVRKLQGSPNVIDGTALDSEGITDPYKQDTPPANAIDPIATNSTSRIPVQSSVTPVVPDPDPKGGLGSKQIIQGLGAAGVVAYGLAALHGRFVRGLPKIIEDATISGKPRTPGVEPRPPGMPTPQAPTPPPARPNVTPATDLRELPTSEQGITAGTNKRRPIKKLTDLATENLNTDTRKNVRQNMEIADWAATPHEVAAAAERMKRYGEMSSGRTVPFYDIKNYFNKALDENQSKLAKQAIEYQDLIDRYKIHLDDVNTELANVRNAYRAGHATGQQVADVMARQRATADPNYQFVNRLTRRDMEAVINQANADPKVAQGLRMYRQPDLDMMAEFVREGLIDRTTAVNTLSAHPNYMLRQTDKAAGLGFWKRAILHAKEQTASRIEGEKPRGTEVSMFSRPRAIIGPIEHLKDAETGVKNAIDPIDALERRYEKYIRYKKGNDARRLFTEAIQYDSTMWGKDIRRAYRPMTVTEFNQPNSVVEKLLSDPRTYVYTHQGQVHIMQAGDRATAVALRYNPAAVQGIWNYLRRKSQLFLTGPGSVFSPVSAGMEMMVGMVTAPAGRAVGPLETIARRALIQIHTPQLIENVVGMALRPADIPVMIAQMTARATIGISATAVHAMGTKIANDLATDSGVIGQIAKLPGADTLLQKVGETMVRTYNETQLQMMHRFGIGGENYSFDPSARALNSYNMVASIPENPAARVVTNAAKGMAKAWSTIFTNFGTSAQQSFFINNLILEAARHKNKIPAGTLQKLVKDTKLLSQDISKAPGSDSVSKLMSSVNYAYTSLAGASHLVQAMKNHPFQTTFGVVSGVFAPWAAMVTYISSDPELADWYYNDVPDWQRVRSMPTLSPEYLIKSIYNGKFEKITPDDITLIPMFQEMLPIIAPMLNGFRSLGWIGASKQTNDVMAAVNDPSGDFMLALKGLMPLQFNAFQQGLVDLVNITNTDNPPDPYNPLGTNSESWYHGLYSSALSMFGTVGNMIDTGTDVAIQDLWAGKGVKEAFADAMGYALATAEQKVPESVVAPAGIYTGGQRRVYSRGGARERNNEAMAAATIVGNQISNEANNAKNARSGLQFPHIRDPQVLQMAQFIDKKLNSGEMKLLQMRRQEINKDVTKADANRDKLSPASYIKLSNSLRKDLHYVDAMQNEVLNQLNDELARMYPQYGGTLPSAVKVIQQNTY